MEPLEIRGKTVEEAVERALEQLGLGRDEVEIEVIQKGKSGFFGLGAEEARVRVWPVQHVEHAEDEPAQVAREVLEKLLSLMGVVASVEVKVSSSEGTNLQASSLTLNINGDDLGILIGRRGHTLSSLQHVLRLIIAHRFKRSLPLSVDVEGYKQRHDHSLSSLALRLARRVSSSGRPITLEPMPANERRVIHLTLSDHPEVTTQSVGFGEGRKVVISPKGRQPSSNN